MPPPKKIRNNISRYFGYYEALLENLRDLYRHESHNRKVKIAVPTFRNEVRILALCYLDALSTSAGYNDVGDFISKHSRRSTIPRLVSMGRVYSFASLLLRATTPEGSKKAIRVHLKKHFWKRDLEKVDQVVKKLQSESSSMNHFRLMLKALKEFTWQGLSDARREGRIFLPVIKVDKEPQKLFEKFWRFIKRGPNKFDKEMMEFGVPCRVNRIVFRQLIKAGIPREAILDIFGLFTYSQVFRRDYRNPMVHRTISLSQDRELPIEASMPYYWFNAVKPRKTQLEAVVPDKYWIETLRSCLKSYRMHCIKASRDPIRTDFRILR